MKVKMGTSLNFSGNLLILVEIFRMSDFTAKYNNGSPPVEIPFSHLLNEEEKGELDNNLNIVKFRKKDIIFRQNTRTSHIMFIKSGLVKIFREARNDKVVILKVVPEGQFIGLMDVFGESVHRYSASAITEAEICDLDIGMFKNIMLKNGRFALQFLNILSMDGLFIFDRLMGQSHKQLPGRIADVILYFSTEIYKSDTFSFPFTRKELADLAGTTKESFIRTLTEFRNDKIIELDGSQIRIKSMDIIKTLSDLG